MDGQDSADGSRGHADTHPHPPLKYVDDTLTKRAVSVMILVWALVMTIATPLHQLRKARGIWIPPVLLLLQLILLGLQSPPISFFFL